MFLLGHPTVGTVREHFKLSLHLLFPDCLFTNLHIPFSWVLNSKIYLLILSFSGPALVPPVMMLPGNCIIRPVISSKGVNSDAQFVVILNLVGMVGNTFIHVFIFPMSVWFIPSDEGAALRKLMTFATK